VAEQQQSLAATFQSRPLRLESPDFSVVLQLLSTHLSPPSSQAVLVFSVNQAQKENQLPRLGSLAFSAVLQLLSTHPIPCNSQAVLTFLMHRFQKENRSPRLGSLDSLVAPRRRLKLASR
jgi:hypothetical protein